MQTKRWNIKQSDDAKTELLKNDLSVHAIIATLLTQRGITDFDSSKTFFRPSLEMLHDPFLMKGMDVAIERINKALENKEPILVYGDYDVDGTTAVALVYSFFKQYTSAIRYYIPDRYAEGYGISFQGIDYAHENGYTLIIALDCGIKANDKVAYATSKTIDFIICDHHLPGDTIPAAIAVLDPKQNDCAYPYKELSGCGIGFKLVQAFCQKNQLPLEKAYTYLDLVTTSIAADIVPITGENRVLAYYGLQQLNEQPRPGIKALFALNNFSKLITINSLVFTLAPRINAAGRMEHGSKAVELLVAEDDEKALSIAETINITNSNRRDTDVVTTSEALQLLEENPLTPFYKSTVLYSNTWHKGIVGIVASRVIEKYYKPTIILTESHGKATGSARSVKDFDVYQAIEACSDLLEQFGGHKYAAGLTLKLENVEAFKSKFEEVVASRIEPHMLQPEVDIDAEIDLDEINNKLLRILKQFEPHGPENMTPVFCSTNVLDTGQARVVGASHLKLELYQPHNPSVKFSAIAFDKSEYLPVFQKQQPVDVVYKITENNYRDTISIQLTIEGIRVR